MSAATEGRARYLNAPRNTDHTIDQQWHAYTEAEHDRWNRLYAGAMEVLPGRACDAYMQALDTLDLTGGIPDMAELSTRLQKLTGWSVVPVHGLIPDDVFFDHLANRRFPAGAFIRTEAEMEYLEEPDVFHDIFGHVPLLADPTYAAFLEAYGKGGARAMAEGRLKNLARLYWYTVEFGLIDTPDGLRIFGAGIMSSAAECKFALEDPSPHRIRFDMERVMRTDYIIDDFQQTYFVIDSFEALLEECYKDFSPLYERLAGATQIAPNDILREDLVMTKGTLDYFTKGAA
ncbi:MAG: phenylalanine 4-monooxygenase [Pseudomonadota bacterium]